jgi:hypothetical protein
VRLVAITGLNPQASIREIVEPSTPAIFASSTCCKQPHAEGIAATACCAKCGGSDARGSRKETAPGLLPRPSPLRLISVQATG